MKKIDSIRLCFFALVFCFGKSYAQWQQVPIINASPKIKANQSARVQATATPIKLPFWDDFSFNRAKTDSRRFSHPTDSLWKFGQSVWVNAGMAINAPSYKVATFDGLDSLGLPYNVSTPTAKGVADRLTSRPLRLDLIDRALRDSVFISFYYEWKGRGEAPDPQDAFSLWFRGGSNTWKQVWMDTIKNHIDSVFVPVKLRIDTSYFHNDFQFRFQNSARLSGPFDTWHLDYVYVSNGQPKYFPYLKYKDFPDRTFTAPVSSPLLQYQSIPIKHLLVSGNNALKNPSVWVNNLRADKTPALNGAEPRNLITQLTTTARVNKIISSSTVPLGNLSAQSELVYQKPVQFTFNSLLDLKNIDPKTDSLAFTFEAMIHEGDNSVKKSIIVNNAPTTVGDYDSIAYKGIDFRHNDTIRTSFKLKNYYAYDDGVAEYALTLTQPGAFAAYQFDMFYPQPDTLKAFDIYFPHVGDESYQIIRVLVYDTLVLKYGQLKGTTKKGILTSQNLVVPRSANDSLVRVKLDTAVLVNKKFYIGWRQNSFGIIGVGLDKDSNSGQKLFYNTTGDWKQNPTIDGIKGNVMIRPIFGNAPLSVVSGIAEEKISAYPNPNTGIFYLPPSINNIHVMDVTGRELLFNHEEFYDKTQVKLINPFSGIYLVRYFDGARWHTEKIMVLP